MKDSTARRVLKDADRRLPYQKNIFLPLGGKAQKLKEMSDGESKILNRKALGVIRLSLTLTVAFNISREETTKELMAALSKMYEKPSGDTSSRGSKPDSHITDTSLSEQSHGDKLKKKKKKNKIMDEE